MQCSTTLTISGITQSLHAAQLQCRFFLAIGARGGRDAWGITPSCNVASLAMTTRRIVTVRADRSGRGLAFFSCISPSIDDSLPSSTSGHLLQSHQRKGCAKDVTGANWTSKPFNSNDTLFSSCSGRDGWFWQVSGRLSRETKRYECRHTRKQESEIRRANYCQRTP